MSRPPVFSRQARRRPPPAPADSWGSARATRSSNNGDRRCRIKLHFAAAEAVSGCRAKGSLFRARRHSKKVELGENTIGLVTMYNLVQGYMAKLPGSKVEEGASHDYPI